MTFAWKLLADPGALRAALESASREMATPLARLQIRGGAGGGNPNQAYLDGTVNGYVREVSTAPLDFEKPIDSDERHRAYVEGGLVPVGKAFLIESIDWVARADGDSNGHAEVLLQVGAFPIVHVTEDREARETRRVLHTLERGVETVER